LTGISASAIKPYMKKIIACFFLLLSLTAFADFDDIAKHYSWDIAAEHKYAIRQEKLDMYRQAHPRYNFPKNIKDLGQAQARQILKYFWENYRFGELKYEEVQAKVWTMFVKMDFSECEKTINESIREYYRFGIYSDGKNKNMPDFYAPFGSVATINLLNGMKSENVPEFLKILEKI